MFGKKCEVFGVVLSDDNVIDVEEMGNAIKSE